MEVDQPAVEVPGEPGEPRGGEEPAGAWSPPEREGAGADEGQPDGKIGHPAPRIVPAEGRALSEYPDDQASRDQEHPDRRSPLLSQ
jgi:hypothetical protein